MVTAAADYLTKPRFEERNLPKWLASEIKKRPATKRTVGGLPARSPARSMRQIFLSVFAMLIKHIKALTSTIVLRRSPIGIHTSGAIGEEERTSIRKTAR